MRGKWMLGAVIATLATTAFADERGDPRAGEAFARRMCADCHIVADDQRSTMSSGARAFREIARHPGMSPLAMSVFLQSPHRFMPSLVLTTEDRTNVIAYITSLR